MIIEPIGKPKPKPIPFGIYQKTVKTAYGYKDIGKYKGKSITIYHDKEKGLKMTYIQQAKKWVQSKLTYFQNGIKKVVRSKNEFIK